MVSTFSDGAVSAQNQPLPQNIAPGDHKDKEFIEVYTVPEPPDSTRSLRFLPSFSWARISRHLRPTKHPFSSSHEAPDWLAILVHLSICILAALVTKLFVSVAPKRDLFWVRTIVHLNTLLVSLAINITLLGLTRPLLEAVAWATIIHRSRSQATGMDLKDIVTATEGSNDALAACRIFRLRRSYNGNERRRRYAYDPGHWSIYIVFYLLAFTAAISTDFFLGRIIEIDTEIEHQNIHYSEVRIKGGISTEDWNTSASTEYWIDSLPSTEDHSLQLSWNNMTVYFVDNLRSLLVPNPPGNCKSFSTRAKPNGVSSAQGSPPIDATHQSASMIRFSTWGTRIRCLEERNESSIYSVSGDMKALVANETFNTLFSGLGVYVPQYNLHDLGELSFNRSIAFSLYSDPYIIGNRLVTIHSLLIALDTRFIPPNATAFLATQDDVGYDVATCLEVHEPWVVEAQNSTSGFPTLTRILDSGSNLNDSSTKEVLLGKPIDDVQTMSSMAYIPDIFIAATLSAHKRFDRENSGDWRDPPEAVFSISENMPNVTVDETTYNGISVQRLEEYLGKTISRNTLSYLSSCDDLLARSYEDAVVAHARTEWRFLYAFLAAIALIGVLAGLFVPKLPLGLPRRDFGAYSWLSAFHGGELEGDLGSMVVKRGMHIREMEDTLGDVRFRYVI